MKMWVCRENDEEMGKIVMDSADYPEVTFENSPQEVELVIKK